MAVGRVHRIGRVSSVRRPSLARALVPVLAGIALTTAAASAHTGDAHQAPAAGSASSGASAQDVPARVPKVGDEAPALGALTMLAGAPVTALERGQVHLVVFWAPWSGASTQLFPRLADLQRRHGERGLEVVAITAADARGSTFERARSALEELRAFTGFSIAFDPAGVSQQRYLGTNAPPMSFLIDRQGRIVVAGNPVESELRLPAVLAGQHDLDALELEVERRPLVLADGIRLQRQFDDAFRRGDWATTRARCDDLLALDRARFRRFAVVRFQIYLLYAGRLDEAYAEGRALLEGLARDDVGMLGTIAWSIVDPSADLSRRDLALAAECAQRAVDLSGRRNPTLLETLARVHHALGALERAIDVQREACHLDPTREGPLREYEAELAQRAK